ncbi:MAG: DNA repair protein RecN [Flavobacteriales bacterium]|nr:DNA repair protein RecN [Flavobacteriales bacterium]
MLRRISISNYLLIDVLELDLTKGLTIITGETGSGKSLVIGALGLAMGERADAGAVRDGQRRCVIELEVDTKGLGLDDWFTAAEVEPERFSILRRQLDPGGRSRAFVNDTPVRLDQLRELGERLVHVHSQHHTLLLNDPRFQLGLVDHIAGHGAEVDTYTELYTKWRAAERELFALQQDEAQAQNAADFARFQLEELEGARLQADEQAGIEQELGRADHAEELIGALRMVEEAVTDESGLGPVLGRVRQALAKPAKLDASVADLLTRLNSVHIELKDIADEAANSAAAISIDPEKAASLRDRLDLILKLQQKHRVSTVPELIAIQEKFAAELDGAASMSERIAELAKAVETLGNEAHQRAKAMSRARIAAVKPLANKVEAVLHDLGMPHAVFQFEHHTGEPGPHGIDSIRARFSANKDRAPAPLDKVASGGELGRVMLALISLAADSKDLPTVVFDEIDTGVSGEVADRVGSLMARMARDRQILAITHLPQIASKADTHLVVSKGEEGERVATSIRSVVAEERVQALAHMLSGRKVTPAALENARVLLAAKR